MQDSNFAIHFKALAILRASISVGVPPSWAFPLEPRDPRELVWSLRFSSWLKSNFTVSLKLENKLMKIDTYNKIKSFVLRILPKFCYIIIICAGWNPFRSIMELWNKKKTFKKLNYFYYTKNKIFYSDLYVLECHKYCRGHFYPFFKVMQKSINLFPSQSVCCKDMWLQILSM